MPSLAPAAAAMRSVFARRVHRDGRRRCFTHDEFTQPRNVFMKKISILKVQKLKTTSVAAYPIWVCLPFPWPRF
ncbi:hypothetical protein LG3211_3865 [Lysobacter gummosus]|nr:hypothetical protein LG3211_3865 [Lysobacter gummosus]